MISEIPYLRATGTTDRIMAEVDEIQYMLEICLDSQRWTRVSPLGSPFINGTLRPSNQRGF